MLGGWSAIKQNARMGTAIKTSNATRKLCVFCRCFDIEPLMNAAAAHLPTDFSWLDGKSVLNGAVPGEHNARKIIRGHVGA